MNKRGISPLVATLLLVAFSLLIGAITMTWGKSYVEKIQQPKKESLDAFKSAIIIGFEQIDESLRGIQIEYITGRITREEYLQKEKALLEAEDKAAASYCTSDSDCLEGFSCWHKLAAGVFTGVKGNKNNPGKCYSDATVSKIR